VIPKSEPIMIDTVLLRVPPLPVLASPLALLSAIFSGIFLMTFLEDLIEEVRQGLLKVMI